MMELAKEILQTLFLVASSASLVSLIVLGWCLCWHAYKTYATAKEIMETLLDMIWQHNNKSQGTD